MRYFYIYPFKRQYYFPREIEAYPFLKSFFKPYSKLGIFFWWLWNNLPFFKYLFRLKEEKIADSISDIKENIDPSTVLSFNTGTIGFTQKITALGLVKNKNQKIFIKYSNRPLTRELTKHESKVLHRIEDYGCSPKVIFSKFEKEYAILITEYLDGDKLDNLKLNSELLDLILKISSFNLSISNIDNNQDYKNCFAHGDFCPWNLLRVYGNIMPIDWEFAKNYPLGFDLFTYIFQTSFLLMPDKNIEEIVKENKAFIEQYFKNWEIENWKPYLIEFARLKLKRGDVNEGSTLYDLILSLRAYAKEA